MRLKILVISQYYWPEPYKLPDVCEELVRRGHEVHVITEVPNYPEGYIYKEYRKGKNRKQIKDGVKISRTFTIGRRKNPLFRLLNYLSFALSSSVYVSGLPDDYDVVFVHQVSPVTMAAAALTYGKKNKKKVILYCLDLWPASLKVGKVSEKSLLYKIFYYVSRKIYRSVDRLILSSEGFESYMTEQFGIVEEKMIYLPQYSDCSFEQSEIPEKDGIDIVFAGNVGMAQSPETIIRAAELIKHEKNIRIHIVGKGTLLDKCKDLAEKKKTTNVFFHGYLEGDELKYYYNIADAMLLTLTADPTISLTLPLKVMSYMASGKPIIASANGAVQKEIQKAKCGYVVPAEDEKALADAFLRFYRENKAKEMGGNAYNYYRDNFTKEKFIRTLEKEFENFCFEK